MRMAARDERAVLRSGTSVVERGKGPTGSPCSEANRALVTSDETNVLKQTLDQATSQLKSGFCSARSLRVWCGNVSGIIRKRSTNWPMTKSNFDSHSQA